MNLDHDPLALTRVEAARYLGVSPSSFDTLVKRDPGIAKARRYPTSRPVFVKAVLAKWLDAKHGTGCPTTAGKVA